MYIDVKPLNISEPFQNFKKLLRNLVTFWCLLAVVGNFNLHLKTKCPHPQLNERQNATSRHHEVLNERQSFEC